MSTQQYLANRMFGPRPEPRVGFKENFRYVVGELIKLAIAAFVLACIWAFGEGFRTAGKEEGHNEALREVSRLAEDHALLTEYLRHHGH